MPETVKTKHLEILNRVCPSGNLERLLSKFHVNNLFTLLICVHRHIKSFFEPSVMYFNIFYVN